MPSFKFTQAAVRDLPLIAKGTTPPQALYMDTVQPGFGLVVGAKTKTFVAQGRAAGRNVRAKIGHFDPEGKGWTVDKARKRAGELRVQMDRGIDPIRERREAAARGITLADAVDLHLAHMRKAGRAAGTFRNVRDVFGIPAKEGKTKDGPLKDWMRRPLNTFTREELRKRHERITKARGPYSANHAMKMFSAVYNSALKTHDLPRNPVVGVTYNKATPRDDIVSAEELPEWWQKIEKLRMRSPMRADYFEFVLFTGLRRRDAATIKWSEVRFEEKALFRPEPKGGKDKAFWIPLTDRMIAILKRRQEQNAILFAGCEWVFASNSASGHLEEPKEYRTHLAANGQRERVQELPSPHVLRHTYATAANRAGLTEYDIEMLTNHRRPKSSVTAKYVTPEVEALREPQQRVTNWLASKLVPPPTGGNVISMTDARQTA